MAAVCDNYINRIENSAVQRLIPAFPSATPTHPYPHHSNTRDCCPWSKSFKSHRVCSRSKGAILILLWNVIVGMLFGTMQWTAIALAIDDYQIKTPAKFFVVKLVCIFGGIALGQMLLYPIGGLLADIWCGRYKIITLSLVMITLGFLFMSIAGFVLLSKHGGNSVMAIFYISIAMCVILLLLGFSGFQSNAVQFGLDQLLEAPSEDHSLFLHWFVWTSNLGEMIARIIGSLTICDPNLRKHKYLFPLLLAVPSCAMLFISCYKRKWFHREPKTRNPYGLVYKVLQFVAKHKKPLHRSALTFCDDIIPRRIDFAKTKFGGPFTTEVVEDVKTFLRILVMLLFISLTFYCHVSSYNLFPFYALYMGNSEPIGRKKCTANWLVFQSGNLAYMVSIIAIPVYILFILPRVLKLVPRMLHRLWIGILIMFLCVCTMSVLYTTALYQADHHDINRTCLFVAEYRTREDFSHTLEFPIAPLAIPNILTGISLPIISITIFEFISAQSPHTMKGLLLGVFYAIRGMYIIIGYLVVLPFTALVFEDTQVPPFLDCGFFYYNISAVLALVGLAVSLGANRWYRYRDREEKPYSHVYVEDYYAKRGNAMLNNIEAQPHPQIDSSILNYGTMDGT